MSEYINPQYPDLRGLEPEKWMVLSDIAFTVPGFPEFVTEEGFETDCASVPSILWSLGFPKMGVYTNAAIGHDDLYKNQGKGLFKNRKQCDKFFKECMLLLGTPRWKAATMYRGVRIGGWRAWKKHGAGD